MFAAFQCRNGHIDYTAIISHEVGFIRHQACEFFQGAPSAKHRFHLDPVPEQHNCNQGCEFPKKGLITADCDHADGIGVSSGDRDRDQRHHTDVAGSDLS